MAGTVQASSGSGRLDHCHPVLCMPSEVRVAALCEPVPDMLACRECGRLFLACRDESVDRGTCLGTRGVSTAGPERRREQVGREERPEPESEPAAEAAHCEGLPSV